MTQGDIAIIMFLVEIAEECRLSERDVERVAAYVAEVILNTTIIINKKRTR